MSAVRKAVGTFILLSAIAASTEAQSAAAAPATPPAPDIEVVMTEPIHAIVLPMKGSYMQHPEAFQRLAAFFAGRGVGAAGDPFGRYFSDPSVGEANLVWEVGFPASADLTVEVPFEIRDVPASLTAVHVHRGPLEELGTAWANLVQWVLANGYEPAGPACQVFSGGAMSGVVELRLPVQK